MLRVLIVDDSTISRDLLTAILDSDPEIQVVATASDGCEAISLAKEHKPDLITMDIHMPTMNGFETTKEIMIENPTPIVIVSASTAVSEVEWAMRSLEVGALTLKLKPAGPAAPNFDDIARELIETVKSMAEVKVLRHHRRQPKPSAIADVATQKRTATHFRVVAIAASTGGPPALSQLLGELPSDFPVPILLVQHIAAGFVEGFAAWLDSTVPLAAKVAIDGDYLKAGTIYIAPSGRHLGITRGMRVALSDEPPISGFRPSANYLFESCAQAVGDKSVGIILTGMGSDGADGLRTLHAKDGRTMVQDEASSVVFGMPAAAVAAGVADAVLPIEWMAKHLTNLVTRPQ